MHCDLRESFVDSAYRLPQEIARKVWKAVGLLSRNPDSPGLKLERLRGSANGLWSFRIDQHYRGILHRQERLTTFLFVAKEEDAYRFAERVPKVAPPTGAQFVVKLSDLFPRGVATPAPKQQRVTKTGKYLPLARYLLNCASKVDSVTLTFADMERIMDDELPSSARKHRPWWANDASHVQAMAWLSVGWRVDVVKITEESVLFALEP